MPMLPSDYRISFDGPALYRVVVLGILAPSLSDRLEGMAIEGLVADDGTVMSVLVGELTDQAALAGVLKSLYDLHRVIITVEQFSPGKQVSQSKPSDQEG